MDEKKLIKALSLLSYWIIIYGIVSLYFLLQQTNFFENSVRLLIPGVSFIVGGIFLQKHKKWAYLLVVYALIFNILLNILDFFVQLSIFGKKYLILEQSFVPILFVLFVWGIPLYALCGSNIKSLFQIKE